MNTIIPYIVFGCFLLFGSFFILIGVMAAWEGLCTKRWPATFGRVLRSGIDTEVRDAPSDRRHTWILHGAAVVYEYEVAGEKHTANAVHSGNASVSPRHAQRIANRYPVGSDIQVYYNPADPKKALLEPGVPPGLWKLFVVFGPFLAVGLGGILAKAGVLQLRQGHLVLIVGIPTVLIGLFLTWVAVKNLRGGLASKHWLTTTGRIATSVVRQSQVRNRTYFEPVIVYQYTVADTPYANSAINLGGFGGSCSAVDRYPAGATVTVFHDPEHPERAVLEPGIRWSNLFLLAVGLPFIAVGTTLVVLLA